MDPLDLDYLDGPLLAAFLDQLPRMRDLPDVERRRIRRWRSGKRARVLDVDAFLTRYDVALGELPPELYRDHPRKRRAAA